jgi:RNA ligase (TIGR02306 family)
VLRGQVSQGLALPLTRFPELQGLSKGEDVTGTLGIHLYEPPIPACLSGELRGAFPGYIPKTDEERVQNLLPMLEELRGSHFSVTVKIDGSSMSVYNYQDDFGVCGRKWNLQESEKNTFWRLANKYELRSRMPSGYAIQGECAGEGIQENRHKLKGQDFYVFYVFEIDKHRYLELDEMTAFCKDLGLKTVPVYSEDFVMRHALEDLLVLADGPCPLNPTMLREGLVFRLKGGEHKTSFKVISNEYLIKYGL